MNSFQIVSDKTPKGDQPGAIEALVHGIDKGINHQVLLGVTGSGKTFTMANVIERTQRPTLVLAHNKTLAGQLFGELRELFPHNAVEYFVSYYDYYQPEAYVPSTDTFIEKDAKINDEIDRLRHSATRSLLERRDVIIVASVSCIYGLGSSEAYYDQQINLEVGQECDRDDLMGQLVEIQYARNDFDFHRGTFRVRGDVVEIIPVHQESTALRLEFFGDELESISEVDPLRGTTIRKIKKIALYPASHYAVQEERVRNVIAEIRNELSERLIVLKQDGRLLEAQRLEQRMLFDLEQLEQLGHCSGIENYSRYLTGRNEGEPPPCLLDYFDEDWLMFIDESHVSVPQIGGMYRGDRSRKTTLVEHGFRLPSALDNRPLKFDEFVGIQNQVVYVSATPSSYELDLTGGVVVEQIIRPTGLVDPTVIVRPAVTQVDDLLGEVRAEIEHGRRVLVTTLTKRMAEDLTEYYADLGIQVRYLHADIDTIERSAILRDLRLGVFDVLVGINLLREGLDLPEVGLVAVLDADKEGFLRNQTSLIQTMGRAARNEHGRVLLYADRTTGSMQRAMDETERRRTIQTEYNRTHGITPETVIKAVSALDDAVGRVAASGSESGAVTKVLEDISAMEDKRDVQALADQIRARMLAAAEALQFEEAADLRDQLHAIEKISLVVD